MQQKSHPFRTALLLHFVNIYLRLGITVGTGNYPSMLYFVD
jgi:hypothetical protein